MVIGAKCNVTAVPDENGHSPIVFIVYPKVELKEAQVVFAAENVHYGGNITVDGITGVSFHPNPVDGTYFVAHKDMDLISITVLPIVDTTKGLKYSMDEYERRLRCKR